ncbi:MAG: acetaldehyde dehydrogenase (acetylating) [Propionibacteriaceae bacterium]|jgi:acetaldehyde dehydrogenase (acetylating)|nr:acetaldehyde dehydrogenase (acetylating) [Propionibacteriaceae bacterium]
MSTLDKDLASIQQARDLIRAAKVAQQRLATFTQAQVDDICRAMVRAGFEHADDLARHAVTETGMGVPEDKALKNRFATDTVWQAIKDLKTVGIIGDYPDTGITEVGVPLGVIAALIPTTNPTSTAMFKAIIAVKSGNALVISPHPSARACTIAAARLVAAAGEAAGLPAGTISCLETPTMEATHELMTHPDVALILATGGTAMVKAAYSSGKPAIGVGPGNGPAYIERTADIPAAVKRIMDSKTFDNGTICASEQSVVTEDCIKGQVIAEFTRQGGYFLNEAEKAQVGAILMRASGTMNPAIVGRSATEIARLAGITVPGGTRVLLGPETEVGAAYPYSREKLCPVLGFYSQPDWLSACELCIRILLHEGAGHTMTIHSRDEGVIREFALKKPVSRLLVNTAASLGGVGATTGLNPSLTLGCGAIGGNASSDNIGPLNLINIRRVARGRRELADLRPAGAGSTEADTERLVRLVLEQLIGACAMT